MILSRLTDLTRTRLKHARIRTGYTSIRVSNSTRDLLARLEQQHSEPLDGLLFYLAAEALGMEFNERGVPHFPAGPRNVCRQCGGHLPQCWCAPGVQRTASGRA